jgi:hypothetical protein
MAREEPIIFLGPVSMTGALCFFVFCPHLLLGNSPWYQPVTRQKLLISAQYCHRLCSLSYPNVEQSWNSTSEPALESGLDHWLWAVETQWPMLPFRESWTYSLPNMIVSVHSWICTFTQATVPFHDNFEGEGYTYFDKIKNRWLVSIRMGWRLSRIITVWGSSC